ESFQEPLLRRFGQHLPLCLSGQRGAGPEGGREAGERRRATSSPGNRAANSPGKGQEKSKKLRRCEQEGRKESHSVGRRARVGRAGIRRRASPGTARLAPTAQGGQSQAVSASDLGFVPRHPAFVGPEGKRSRPL